jgi:hypothetical protein
MAKYATVTFSMEVSDEERRAATAIRTKFAEFNTRITEFVDFFEILFSSLDQINEGKQLLPIAGVLKKYQFKLKELFNNVIMTLAAALDESSDKIVDTKMSNIRELVIQNMSEVRSLFIDLMGILDNFEDDAFVEKGKDLHEQINKYLEKVQEIVSSELFSHIDFDILGKIRLGSPGFPLFFKRL